MFDVAVMRLTESSVEILPQDGTVIMGYKAGRRLWSRGWQGVRPAPKYLETNEFFDFFHSCNMFSMDLFFLESI